MPVRWFVPIAALVVPGALAQVELAPAGRDLAALLRVQPAGQVVTLGAETYVVTGPLTVDRTLHLRGVHRDATHVVFFGSSATLTLSGDIDVTFEGITFERSGPPDRDLVVARGDVRLRVSGCRFDGGLPILVEGPVPTGYGILIELESGTAELTDNEIGRNAYGVGVGLTSRVTLLGNTIVENAVAGIRFFGDALAAASGNLVAMNGWGIAVGERADVALEGNAVSGDFRGGFWFDGDAHGDVVDHVIVSHAIGVVIGGRATPTIRGNTITCAFGSGIVGQGSARPRIGGNEVRDHGGVGLVFGEDAAGSVVANVIVGNAGNGVLVAGRAARTLEDNTLTGNGNEGILYQDEDGGVARINVIEGHANVGVLVRTDARLLLEANVLRGNVDGAIEYHQRAGGAAIGNVCEGEAAIETREQSSPELVGNLFKHLDMRQP